ncbi:MAG: peroxiredoxin [Pseudomonadota bacterium]
MKIGDKIPDLTLPATGGKPISLMAFKGKNLVVYFYPKDNTPGCTQEGIDLRDLRAHFQNANTEIVGLSRDSVRSHENFATKFELNFPLLADTEEKACQAFDVMREKTLYGKKYLGVDRSTFLFDAQGVLRHEWRNVSVKGHAIEVLEAAKAL